MKNREVIRFAFIGDVFLGGEFLTYAEQHKLEHVAPFRRVLPVLEKSDVLLLNLEGPLHAGQDRRAGVTSYLSNHPDVIEIFAKCGTVYNLANNHIMDFGWDGLQKTIVLLEERGLPFVGAGRNAAEAGNECIVELRGKRIAFLSYASPEPHVGAVTAGESTPGCVSPENVEAISARIRKLKESGHVVCVSVHWGFEFFFYPDPRQVSISRIFADSGADYVIGNHPHVRQGFERRGNSLILYSIGNFFLPPIRSLSGRLQLRKNVSREFLIVQSEIDGGCPSAPVFIGGRQSADYTLEPYREKDARRLEKEMVRLSVKLVTEEYAAFFDEYRKTRGKELVRDSVCEAIMKAFRTPLPELLRTVNRGDLRRNLERILRCLGN